MGIRVGVVCEGSHDFNVLEQFIDQIVRQAGEVVDAIDCLQPEVSATFQVSDGGWNQVRLWCLDSGGQGYRRYFDAPIFSTSRPYDIIVVHLDGDVVTHCESENLQGLHIDGMSVQDVVETLKLAICAHWLSLSADHKHKIVACIPVRHLEAWLSAAIGPRVIDHEQIDMKNIFRQGPVNALSGNWRMKYIRAAKAAKKKCTEIKSRCLSYCSFEDDLIAAIEVS